MVLLGDYTLHRIFIGYALERILLAFVWIVTEETIVHAWWVAHAIKIAAYGRVSRTRPARVGVCTTLIIGRVVVVGTTTLAIGHVIGMVNLINVWLFSQ